MKPISSFPAKQARALRGVCFDVDDTFTTDGKLEPEAYAALWRLRRAGLRLVLMTGRPLGWVEFMVRQWPVDLGVGENGAGWVCQRKKRFVTCFVASADVRRDQRAKLARLREDVHEKLPTVRVSSDDWARRCDLAFDVAEEQELPQSELDQLLEIIEAHGALPLVSSVHAHASFQQNSKPAGACRALQEELDIDLASERARWMFIGDSGNDAEAFAWFPVTCGVANVEPWLSHMPTPPVYVAQADAGAGFAEICQAILQARHP